MLLHATRRGMRVDPSGLSDIDILNARVILRHVHIVFGTSSHAVLSILVYNVWSAISL